MCPKSKTWMCDGDCLACEFRATGDNLSLDYTVEDGEGNQKSWADDLPDDTPNAQSIMEDRELLCALYQKLQELDPEGRRICELIMEGKSERDIASALGVSRNTYTYRRDKLLRILREQLGIPMSAKSSASLQCRRFLTAVFTHEKRQAARSQVKKRTSHLSKALCLP